MLDRQAPLASAEHQLVTTALQAATDLAKILGNTPDQFVHETRNGGGHITTLGTARALPGTNHKDSGDEEAKRWA